MKYLISSTVPDFSVPVLEPSLDQKTAIIMSHFLTIKSLRMPCGLSPCNGTESDYHMTGISIFSLFIPLIEFHVCIADSTIFLSFDTSDGEPIRTLYAVTGIGIKTPELHL